jgi:hypothetical protein
MSELRAATLSRVLTVNDAQRRDREQRIADAHRRLDAILERYTTDHALDDTDRKMVEIARLRLRRASRRISVKKTVLATLPKRQVATASMLTSLPVGTVYRRPEFSSIRN